MKKILIALTLSLFAGFAHGQSLHIIKFVHVGIEDKPIGTLVISVEKIVHPTDRGDIDNIFGKSVKTDIRTFELIEKFIEKHKSILSNKNRQIDYEIIVNNSATFYLGYKNNNAFFNELRSTLTKSKADKAVLDALKNKPN